MIKVALSALVIAVYFSQPLYPIYAVESTPSSTRKENVLERKEEKKDLLQERRDKIKTQVQNKLSRLQNKLNTFKDKTRAKTVERLNELLAKINENRTNHMNKQLENLQSILDRVEKRAQTNLTPEASASSQVAIDEAQTAIDSAKEAVLEQAGMDYTVTVASESGVRSDVKKVRDSLHTDLTEVRRLIINAKQGVANAIRVVARNSGGTNEQ